jgi:hypothetical protein
MPEFGGYCGLDCDRCPALVVGDRSGGEADVGDDDARTIPCGGCYSDQSDEPGCCFEGCPIRSCARKRGVFTCAECGGYVCDVLEEFFSSFPGGEAAKRNLESRRTG